MRIAIAQLAPTVGDFDKNLTLIRKAYERACHQQARLLLTPELGICGYPPHDLVDRPEWIEKCEQALDQLTELTRGQDCALVIGHVAANPLDHGRRSLNQVTVLEGGQRVFSQSKSLLPTYDVFDEARYFEPASGVELWLCDGRRIALAICEDLWANDPSLGRRLYRHVDPVERYREAGAELVLAISASPYEWGKRGRREALHAEVVKRLQIPLVYVNQTGATDEILFDGASFAMSSQGAIEGRLPAFETAFGTLEWDAGKLAWTGSENDPQTDPPPPEIAVLAKALVSGIQEYFSRTGFKTAILGLSGGIDSAVVAALATRALGAADVRGVAMPSQYSSGHSLEDAEILARNLGIPFEVRPIKFLYATASRELTEGREVLAPLALENLQARLRGNIIMTLANHYGALALVTGNKSELAMGYCTMYGDMAGALGPIGDVFKTRVYELAHYINAEWGAPIPKRSITKAPSAELRPDQKDQDTLPPYELLDDLIEDYIEKGLSISELRAKHAQALPSQPRWVEETISRLEMNEYKRRQAAPVLKISTKAFGIGRRIPIAKSWNPC